MKQYTSMLVLRATFQVHKIFSQVSSGGADAPTPYWHEEVVKEQIQYLIGNPTCSVQAFHGAWSVHMQVQGWCAGEYDVTSKRSPLIASLHSLRAIDRAQVELVYVTLRGLLSQQEYVTRGTQATLGL